MAVTNDEGWNYYRVLIEGNEFTLYIDGIKRFSQNLPSTTRGYWSFYGTQMDGAIDDFRTYPTDALAESFGYDKYGNRTKSIDASGFTQYT